MSKGRGIVRRNIDPVEYKQKIGQDTNRKIFEKSNSNHIMNQKTFDRSKGAVDFFGNSSDTYDAIQEEFLRQTKLNKVDYAFVFLAVALQCTRIYLINALTKVEKAGSGNKKEGKLHDLQERILGKFGKGLDESKPYYASLDHIISTVGVPYDATAFLSEKYPVLSGANHRFSTLGHDPLLGLMFGTGNIMTNTISTVDKPLIKLNHVVYDAQGKNPKIGGYGSNIVMLDTVVKRAGEEPQALVASLIKQIIHIGTDLYTPCGIQLPFINLMLDKKNVENITKYISTGNVIKWSTSAGLKEFIDIVIQGLHCMCCNSDNIPYDLYMYRTKKVIDIADVIAEGSNVIAVAIMAYVGEPKVALTQMDIGGIVSTIKKVISDVKLISKIQEEFVTNNFIERIRKL